MQVPVDWVEELLSLLESPVRRHDEGEDREEHQLSNHSNHWHATDDIVKVGDDDIPQVQLKHVPQVEGVDEDQLVDPP